METEKFLARNVNLGSAWRETETMLMQLLTPLPVREGQIVTVCANGGIQKKLRAVLSKSKQLWLKAMLIDYASVPLPGNRSSRQSSFSFPVLHMPLLQ